MRGKNARNRACTVQCKKGIGRSGEPAKKEGCNDNHGRAAAAVKNE
jgi:hypothetical protein